MLKIGCTLVYSYLFTFKYGTLNLMPQMIYPEVLFMVDIHCYIQCLAFGESYPFRNERRETVLGKLDSSCIGLAGLATGFQNPNAMPLLEPYEPASGAFKVFDIQFRSLGKLLGLCEDAVVKNVSIFSQSCRQTSSCWASSIKETVIVKCTESYSFLYSL